MRLPPKPKPDHASQSMSQRSGTEISMSQRAKAEAMSEEQLVAATIRVKDYLLADLKSLRKFKKDEIVVNALNKSSRQYGEIMMRVKQIFSNVLGLRMVRLPNKDDEFIILNTNPSKYLQAKERMSQTTGTPKCEHENLILQVVLSSILMDKGSMFESHLFKIMDHIGFTKSKFYSETKKKPADYIPKTINNFVKMMFLDAEKVDRPRVPQNPPLPPGEGKVTKYSWGYRAMLEVDIDKVVKYITEIHDGSKPYYFPVVYVAEQKELQANLRAELGL